MPKISTLQAMDISKAFVSGSISQQVIKQSSLNVFSGELTLLVGVAITSQTLSAAITASIKEFAALRALGVSRHSLRCVVIEQAAWIGFIGLLLTAALTIAIALLGEAANIAMAFPVWLLAGNVLIMMAIAVGSGLLALKPLLNTEPVTLLR